MNFHSIYITLFVIALFSCGEVPNQKLEPQVQEYYISNYSANNQIESPHIFGSIIINDTLFFDSNIDNVINQIDTAWLIGQGTNEIYFDTGKEKLYKITEVNQTERWLRIKNNGSLNINLPLVFWKERKQAKKILDIPGSWGFSKIIYDSTQQEYQTHLFQCDQNQVNIYIGHSKDLINWTNDALPILIPSDFSKANWSIPTPDSVTKVTPLISDIVYFQNKYYCFAYGDDLKNKTYISILTADSLNGIYSISSEPVLSPNLESAKSNHDVYMPRVIKTKKNWIMFYTGKNEKNEEYICRAISNNLIDWSTTNEAIITRNKGWNSNKKNQLVSQLQFLNDTLFMWCTGSKNTSQPDGTFSKGNVMDISIGKYYSIDEGISFSPVNGNPMFGGNVTNPLENDHIGAPIQTIIKNDSSFTFYHAKGRNNKIYSIMLEVD